MDRHELNKRRDISKIAQMFRAIGDLDEDKAGFEETLIIIGDLSGGHQNKILFNDKADPQSYYVRNKYGYIQRNKGNVISQNGIYFEKLFHLKIILEGQDFVVGNGTLDFNLAKPAYDVKTAFKKEEEKIRGEMENLKLKLAFILCNEEVFISEEDVATLSKAKELIAGSTVNPEDSRIGNMISFSESCYEQAILSRVKHELDDLKKVADFSCLEVRYYVARIFVVIGELLHEFLENKNVEQHAILKSLKNINGFRDSFIHHHSRTVQKPDAGDISLLLTNVPGLAGALSALISSSDTGELIVRVDTDCADLNTYIAKIEEFLTAQVAGTVAQPPATKASKAKTKDPEKEVKGIIMSAAKMIEKNPANLQDQLDALNKQYEVQYKLISGSEVAYALPPTINHTNHRDNVTQSASQIKSSSEKKKEQQAEVRAVAESEAKQAHIIKVVERISVEIDYLSEIEKADTLHPNIKEYCLQHIISVIGQYIRELDEINAGIAENSSRLLDEATWSAKASGTDGLRHNILDYSQARFDQRLQANILPAREDFNSIYIIYQNQGGKTPISTILLNNLGMAYLRMSLYHKSIECFTGALSYIEQHPDKVQQEKMSSMGVDASPVARFYDLDKAFFGIDSYTLKVKSNLSSAYIVVRDFDNAYHMLKQIIDAIDVNEVFNLGTEELVTNIVSTLNSQAICLAEQKQYDKAIEIFLFLKSIHDIPEIVINLAHCYNMIGNIAPAQELLEQVLSGDDHIAQFNALSQNINLLLGNITDVAGLDIIVAQKEKLTKLLASQEACFKEKQGDRYFLDLMVPIIVDIKIISQKASLARSKKMDYDFKKLKLELQKAEESFSQLFDKLKHDITSDKTISTVYLSLSSACVELIIEKEDTRQSEEKLEKAQEFYNKGSSNAQFSEFELHIATNNLAVGYSNYALWHCKIGEDRIQYLELCFKMQKSAGYDTNITQLNLGIEYNNLAESYKSGVNGYAKSVEQALANYNKAIEYLERLIESDLQSFRLEAKIEAYKALGGAYEEKGNLTFDMDSLSKALDYYQDAISLQSDLADVQDYMRNSKARILDIKEIEKRIVEQLDKLKQDKKISGKSDIEIEIAISKISDEDLKGYCEHHLHLGNASLEFVEQSCYITIEPAALQILGIV